ncbi:MAG: short-chain dehydrogenase [Akkermansiaceae bacterium]|nr:short-chain dehydrogenase [Akkermansiaceae bacterium]
MKLTHDTILITGGTSGIGLELAGRLLTRGNTVIVTGRDPVKLAATREKLPGLHAIQSDVSDPEAIAALYQKVTAEFPALNVLINNAGIMRKIDLQDGSTGLRDITRELETNLSGPVRMVQQFLPHLRRQKEAAIVNVTSGLAFVPFPLSPIYSATKAGLRAYTRSLRFQLKNSTVKVFELAPPGTETPLFRNDFEEVKDMKAMDVRELGRLALLGLTKDRLEIRPGLSNVLKIMSRLAPELIFKQLGKLADPMISQHR